MDHSRLQPAIPGRHHAGLLTPHQSVRIERTGGNAPELHPGKQCVAGEAKNVVGWMVWAVFYEHLHKPQLNRVRDFLQQQQGQQEAGGKVGCQQDACNLHTNWQVSCKRRFDQITTLTSPPSGLRDRFTIISHALVRLALTASSPRLIPFFKLLSTRLSADCALALQDVVARRFDLHWLTTWCRVTQGNFICQS